MQSCSWWKHFPEAELFTVIRPVGDFSFWSLLRFLKRKGRVVFYGEVCRAAGREQTSRAMARLYRQAQAAEARLRQAEQESSPSQTSPSEFAKQHITPNSEVEAAPPSAVLTTAEERQERLSAIAGDLIYWKGGLKVLRQALLPKWRGSFKWQIEAKIEALQAAYARLRAEAAKPDA